MNYKLFSGPVVFSPDGKYVASGGCDKVDDLYNCTLGIVRIKQMVNGQQIAQITHGLNVPSLAFRPDGKYLVTGGCDRKTDSGNCDFGSIRVWDVANWQEIAHMMQEGGIVSVIFSPDGRYVMSGGEDGTARVWDVTSKQEITRMNHGATEYSYSVDLSQDGLYMVSGSDLDNTVRVWEIASGEEIVHMTHESKSGVFAAAFSPNGRYVASGSSDSTARVWDISTGLEIARISHKSTVSSVAFSPDGQYVVSGSSLDNTARG